jgi:Ca2+/H+ antiporter
MEFCPFLCSPLIYIHPAVYGSYLVFQLFSHKALYDDSNVPKSTQYAPRRTFKQVLDDRAEKKAKKNGTWEPREPTSETAGMQTDIEAHTAEAEDEEDKPEIPKMSVPMTVGLLAVVTVVCGFLSVVTFDIMRFCSLWLLLPNGWLIPSTVSPTLEQSARSSLVLFYCQSLVMLQVG